MCVKSPQNYKPIKGLGMFHEQNICEGGLTGVPDLFLTCQVLFPDVTGVDRILETPVRVMEYSSQHHNLGVFKIIIVFNHQCLTKHLCIYDI